MDKKVSSGERSILSNEFGMLRSGYSHAYSGLIKRIVLSETFSVQDMILFILVKHSVLF